VPFTPAHAAAVLPLVGRRRPGWVVPSALVIGSMVPDVLYFVPIRSDRDFSHSLTGLVTLDLALGLVFVAIWKVVAAPVVRDLAPQPIRLRLPIPDPLTSREAVWAVPGVVLGGLTHIVWDSFTHANGWMVLRLPFLTADVGLPVFKLAQYASGILGCAVLLLHALRLPVVRRSERVAPLASARERLVAQAVLAGVPVVCALAFALPARADGAGTEMLLYVAVVRGVSGLGLAACAVAAWWHVRVRPRRVDAGAAARSDVGV
jgi:uncharacterized protein DUF4184